MKIVKAAVCVVLFFLLYCSKSPTDISEQTEINNTVTYDDGVYKFKIDDKMSLEIPEGAVPSGETFVIKKVNSEDIPSDSEMLFSSVYEISFSSGDFFEKPVTLTLYYDDDTFDDSIAGGVAGAVFYNEDLKRWIRFSDCSVDTNFKTVSIVTNHFCKLAIYQYHRILGYTDYLLTDHFRIYWVAGKPLPDSTYSTKRASQMKSGSPHYIQDIGYYLEESYTAYKKAGLKVQTNRVDVRVLDLKGDNGNSSFFGVIRINDSLGLDAGTDYPTVLAVTCAHEFLHYVQDYYYMQLFSEYTLQWWLEATAVCAYRIVWPTESYSEALDYAQAGINTQIHKSWDDVNGDPEWYTPGGFLHYLAIDRSGKKLNIPALIKAGGANGELSYMRTILNKMLQDSCGADSIGAEYEKYLLAAYEQTGQVTLPRQPVNKKSNFPYMVPIVHRDENLQEKTVTLPYLSAQLIKVVDKSNLGKQTQIIITELPPSIALSAYECKKSASTFLKKVSKGDTLKVNLPDSTTWIDIFAVNRANSGSANLNITTELTLVPEITSVTPVDIEPGDTIIIYGKNFGTDKSNGRIINNSSYGSSAALYWSSDSVIWCIPKDILEDSLKLQVRYDNALSDTFIVDINSDPVIDSILSANAPCSILLPGEDIYVYGQRFSDNKDAMTITVNADTLPLISASATRCWFKLPDTIGGEVVLQVFRAGNEKYIENTLFVGLPYEVIQKQDSVFTGATLMTSYSDERLDNPTFHGIYSNTSGQKLPVIASSKSLSVDLASANIPELSGTITCTFINSTNTEAEITFDYLKSTAPFEEVTLTCSNIRVAKADSFGKEGLEFKLSGYKEINDHKKAFSGELTYKEDVRTEITGLWEDDGIMSFILFLIPIAP